MQKTHTKLGIASLVFGIIAIITCIIPIFIYGTLALVPRVVSSYLNKRMAIASWEISMFIFGILALIFGGGSFYGKRKDPFGLTSLKLGLVSIIVDTFFLVFLIFIAAVASY